MNYLKKITTYRFSEDLPPFYSSKLLTSSPQEKLSIGLCPKRKCNEKQNTESSNHFTEGTVA